MKEVGVVIIVHILVVVVNGVVVVVVMICVSSNVVQEYTRSTKYIFQYTCQLISHRLIHVGPILPALNAHHSHKTRQIRPFWDVIHDELIGKEQMPQTTEET